VKGNAWTRCHAPEYAQSGTQPTRGTLPVPPGVMIVEGSRRAIACAYAAADGARNGRDAVARRPTVARVFDEAVIQEAGRRLLQAAPADTRVILFGSHARGEASKYSDLDFLVIEPEVKDVIEETYRLRCTLRGLDVFADIVLVSEESVREWRDVYGTVIHAALDEGRELAA
jgi:predicted nucleotidyltransferase